MRQYYAILDWVHDQEKKHQSFFILEWIVAFILLFTIGTYVVRGWYGGKGVYEIPSRIHIIVAVITGAITTYLIHKHNLKMTGCAKCKIFPNVRLEIGRDYVRDEERYFVTEDEPNLGEPIYQYTDYKTVRIEKVKFRCKRCGEEWTELQTTSASPFKFLDKQRIR